MIHGESYKPIVAEAAKKSADKVFNRICVTHLLMDEAKENRVAGAVGFNVRTGDYHVFKSKAVIVAAGGASNIFKPRSVGEGAGRVWYAPWSFRFSLWIVDRCRRKNDSNGKPYRTGSIQRRLRTGRCLLPAPQNLHPECLWRRV